MGKKSGGVRIKQVGGMKPPMSKAALASLMAPPKMEDFMIAPEEMVSIPTPPANYKKYQIFFPMYETFTMQTETFQIIYPIYIDPTKTIHQGRRLPIHLLTSTATSSDINDRNRIEMIDGQEEDDGAKDEGKDEEIIQLSPTIQEVSQVLQNMNIRHVTQPYKCYSRTANLYDNPGRCLVDIKSTSYTNKYNLLIDIAKQIHILPIRKQRIEQERQQRHEQKEKLVRLRLQAANADSTTVVGMIEGEKGTVSNTSTTNNNKKKGKKKK